MHQTTFEYLKPTDDQLQSMAECRQKAGEYADLITKLIPDSPDKTYLLRKFREVAMWVNIAITRHPDGSPRQ